MRHIERAICISLILSLPRAIPAQEKRSPQPRATPQFTGELVATDGVRLTLRSKNGSKSKTFTGTAQSTCIVPQQSTSAAKPLRLSEIPIGSLLTVYYVRHSQKIGTSKPSENVILAIRLDSERSERSTLPIGVAIPCFKPADKTSKQ